MVQFNVQALTAAVALSMALPSTLAHPGEKVTPESMKREMSLRNQQHAAASRSLAKCQNSPAALALKQRAIARRAEKVTKLRKERGLTASTSKPDLLFIHAGTCMYLIKEQERSLTALPPRRAPQAPEEGPRQPGVLGHVRPQPDDHAGVQPRDARGDHLRVQQHVRPRARDDRGALLRHGRAHPPGHH